MVSLYFLESLREEKKWTHKQLSEKIGISPRTWRRIRNIKDYKPSEDSVKKMEHTQRVYVGVKKRRIRKILKEAIPTIDKKFGIFSTRQRAYAVIRANFRSMRSMSSLEALDASYDDYFVRRGTALIMSAKDAKYIHFPRQYGIDYINVTLNVEVVTEDDVLERSYPAFSEYVGDTGRAAVENALHQILDPLSAALFAQYKEYLIRFKTCEVVCVTKPTKEKIPL